MAMKVDLTSSNIGFIGGGNMATAIATGLIKKGGIDPRKMWVSARTKETLASWAIQNINVTLENKVVVQNCDIIFLAVKPYMYEDVIASFASTRSEKISSKLIISVLVGISVTRLNRMLTTVIDEPRVIRCLPSTPVLLGEGIIAYCRGTASQKDVKTARSLFSLISVTEEVAESLINAIGGLSGSGPAYAYLIIESLADGAVKMGVPRSTATKFAAQVLVGAGKMVLETGKHPGQLKDEVCSAGGTTITGVHAMECGGVRAAMMNAVEAAVNKSNELSSKLK